ncbi:unnamed protein product, partial [Symbiodinium sp. CCMP2456]
ESLLPASASKSFHPELLSTLRILERETQTSSNGPSSGEREARAEQKGGKGPILAACGCTTGLWRYVAGQLNLSRCCSLRSLLGYTARGEAAPTRTALVSERLQPIKHSPSWTSCSLTSSHPRQCMCSDSRVGFRWECDPELHFCDCASAHASIMAFRPVLPQTASHMGVSENKGYLILGGPYNKDPTI